MQSHNARKQKNSRDSVTQQNIDNKVPQNYNIVPGSINDELHSDKNSDRVYVNAPKNEHTQTLTEAPTEIDKTSNSSEKSLYGRDTESTQSTDLFNHNDRNDKPTQDATLSPEGKNNL